MWVFYTTLVLFALLTGYSFVLPLYKKRPVLIKEGELVVYFFLLTMALLQFFGIWALIVGMLIMLFLYLLKPWFVYGVTSAMLSGALEKAALATRAPIEKLDNKYKIDGGMEIGSFNLAEKTNLVSFKKISDSKKARLTVAVFKKFIQNSVCGN